MEIFARFMVSLSKFWRRGEFTGRGRDVQIETENAKNERF
jgi:hypothetical protein